MFIMKGTISRTSFKFYIKTSTTIVYPNFINKSLPTGLMLGSFDCLLLVEIISPIGSKKIKIKSLNKQKIGLPLGIKIVESNNLMSI